MRKHIVRTYHAGSEYQIHSDGKVYLVVEHTKRMVYKTHQDKTFKAHPDHTGTNVKEVFTVTATLRRVKDFGLIQELCKKAGVM
ncbi:MAG: hypothetical protein JNL32_01210 [Candidatus Kapabacteria bacterium]|nr:hypothetical protein [Candidatus Kapabacteria bacterium]